VQRVDLAPMGRLVKVTSSVMPTCSSSSSDYRKTQKNQAQQHCTVQSGSQAVIHNAHLQPQQQQ
jgi:hypothetical protein